MKVISSQPYLNWDIVEQKKADMVGLPFASVLCYEIGEVDGEEIAILADGHHTLAAARELGIEVRFSFVEEPEGLSGEAALDARWMDGDWYYVESSDPATGVFDLVW